MVYSLWGACLDKLEKYLEELKPKVVPSSLLGKAIAYSLNNWCVLRRYAESGVTSIDNSLNAVLWLVCWIQVSFTLTYRCDERWSRPGCRGQ